MEDNLSFYEQEHGGAPVHIVSIPIELGSDQRGLAAAPSYLYSCGLEKVLSSIGREVSGKTTIPCPKESRIASAGRMKHVQPIAEVARGTMLAVEQRMKRGDFVIALGGDHSSAIGTIAGAAAAYPSLGVIYIDAHPDCNTDETTITGNVHGMVSSTLMGRGHQVLTSIPKRLVSRNNFLYVGLKDIDQAEIEFLRHNALSSFTMLDIEAHGLSSVFAAIARLSRSVDAVWISMDMDSIDEEYAPGVGLPGQCGLTRREALSIAQYIGKTCNVVGFDIVEMLPAKDRARKTARLALELTARFLGSEYSWYQRNYIDTYRATNVTKREKAAIKHGRVRAA